MGLADDLNEARYWGGKQGAPCSIGVLLGPDGTLKAAEKTALAAALADPENAHNAIARILRHHGHDIRGDTVGRHRRGDCKCSETVFDVPG